MLSNLSHLKVQTRGLKNFMSTAFIHRDELFFFSSRDISQYYLPSECQDKWFEKQSVIASKNASKHTDSLKNLVNTQKLFTPNTNTNQLFERNATTSINFPIQIDNRFSIMLPPPNITGRLHIGHALTLSIEDALTRYNMMIGKRSVFIPGMDHAGISTQVVVEKKLAKENKFRKDMTRSEFLQEMGKWKDLYRGMIRDQINGLGSICNWDREVFTMDSPREIAVKEAFVRLFENQYIYRERKLVNWCCHLQTAISDIEVENLHIKKATMVFVPSVNRQVKFGVLHHFKYPIMNEDGSASTNEFIYVSTTRIETMLGDTAIAIHSEDERYKSYHGKFCLHPFTQRRLPIICDDILVDPKFGTGAVKITPAHDFNDFECGLRHKLDHVVVFDRNGLTVSGISNELFGDKSVDRYIARDIIIEALKRKNLYDREEDHEMQLPICERSKDVLEPMILPQWFVKCKDFANQALELTDNGTLNIHPEKYQIIWKRWLENIHDWCISRQLWWGHQIPAYEIKLIENEKVEEYAKRNNQTVLHFQKQLKDQWIAAHDEKQAKLKAIEKFSFLKDLDFELKQDEDVLDTWFSSGLYPISGLGWPNIDSEDLKQLYPLNVLETGEDILFFWAARMVMLCTYLYQPVEGKILPPFKDIYLHSMVRDSQGRKMSKSLGNVIDPMDLKNGKSLTELEQDILNNTNINTNEIKISLNQTKTQFPNGIPECGIDAMRFSLLQYTHQGRSINLDINKVILSKQFCNKIWQATRFIEKYLTKHASLSLHDPTKEEHGFHNQWILSELSDMIENLHRDMNSYEFSNSTKILHEFFLFKFCDVYLEISKRHLNSVKDEPLLISTLSTLKFVMDTFLRAAHPFMPFITDELWHCINPTKQESILSTEIPITLDEYKNDNAIRSMNIYMTIIQKIRSVKALLVKSSMSRTTPIRIEIESEFENNIWSTRDALTIISDLSSTKYITIEYSYKGMDSERIETLSSNSDEESLLEENSSGEDAETSMESISNDEEEDSSSDKTIPQDQARFTIFPNARLYIPFDSKKVVDSIKKIEKELKSLLNAKEKLINRINGDKYFNTPDSIKIKDKETLNLWIQREFSLEQELKILKDINN